jgi:hypothetical protein
MPANLSKGIYALILGIFENSLFSTLKQVVLEIKTSSFQGQNRLF